MERGLSDAREELADLINQVAYTHERITLTRRGKPLAAIVSMQDLDALQTIENEIDISEADKALKDKTISLENLKEKLDL